MKALVFAGICALALAQAGGAAAAEAKPAAAAAATAPLAGGDAKVPDTVMFATDELNDIQSHISQAGSEAGPGVTSGIESASLYLSTILYFSPNDWTIWLNGIPIGPKQEFQSFQITDITPSSVELLVPLSALGMRPVRLGPNQTFVARSGVVVEGRVQ